MLEGAPLKLFGPRVVDGSAEGRPGRGPRPAARGAGDCLRGGLDRVCRAADAGTAPPARRGGARRPPYSCGHGPRVSPGKGPPPRRGSPARRAPPAKACRRPARPRRRRPPGRSRARCSRKWRSAALTRTARCRRRWIARPAMSAEDRGLATELVYGVLRRRGRIDRAMNAFATQGLDRLDPRALLALRVGAYQILFLDRVPAYAAVDDAVDACKGISGRGIGRLRQRAVAAAVASGRTAAARRGRRSGRLPRRGRGRARLARGAAAGGTARRPRRSRSRPASRSTPPVTLRANTGRITREELSARLTAERAGAALAPSEIAPDAVDARRLDAPAATQAWRDGLFAIADAGAQVVVELCGAAAGERILDACAGIGGKTAHLLALAGDRARVDAARHRHRQAGHGARDAAASGPDGRDAGGGRPDEAAGGSDAALRPHPPRRPVQWPRRAPPAPRSDHAPRPRRSGDARRAAAAHAVGGRAGPPAGRPAGLRGVYVRTPRMRGHHRGVPERAPALRDRKREHGGRPRAVAAAHRRDRARSAPGLTATAPTASSRSACASRAAEARESVKIFGRPFPTIWPCALASFASILSF